MKPIGTIADLNEARSREHSLIFVWVNWAIQARHSEKLIRQVIETLDRDHPECKFYPYRVDVSDQEGEIWDALVTWLRNEPQCKGNILSSGCGALLWLRNGAIVASLTNALVYDRAKLVAVTRSIFGYCD
jgi:hypothetical protein